MVMIGWTPTFEFGLLNGWPYFVFYLVVFGLTLLTCSPEVRKRLYDRSLWTKRTRVLVVIGKIFSFINIISICLGALAYPSVEFILGNFVFALGPSLLVISIIHYRDAPLDKPITNGVYRYSRNPQAMGIYTMFLGMVLLIGSLMNLVLLGLAVVFGHFGILGEESSLEQQYGDSYLEFKRNIPRYFWI
jgi:protein-S-isoprenylcysteine O-methyltransferase Ste14